MPRSKRPSFLKRQKEQQRKARAEEKRAAKRARKLEGPADPDRDIVGREELGMDLEPGTSEDVTGTG